MKIKNVLLLLITLFGSSCQTSENTDNYKTYHNYDKSFSVNVPPGYYAIMYEGIETLNRLMFQNKKEKGFIYIIRRGKDISMNDVIAKGHDFEKKYSSTSLKVKLVERNDSSIHYKASAGFFKVDQYFILKEGAYNNFIFEIGAMDLTDSKVQTVFNSIKEY